MPKSPLKFFRIRNYEKFQHYQDRPLTWVKVQCNILEADNFLQCNDKLRAHYLSLIILASRTKNRMIYDQPTIKRLINATSTVNLQSLLDLQMIEMIDENANNDTVDKKVDTTHSAKAYQTIKKRKEKNTTEKKRKEPADSNSVGYSSNSQSEIESQYKVKTDILTPSSNQLQQDCQLALDQWNDLAQKCSLPKCVKMTRARKAKLQRIIREHGIDQFTQALDIIESSPFLKGDNNRGWKASFNFIITEAKFINIIEGVYSKAKDETMQQQYDRLKEEFNNEP